MADVCPVLLNSRESSYGLSAAFGLPGRLNTSAWSESPS